VEGIYDDEDVSLGAEGEATGTGYFLGEKEGVFVPDFDEKFDIR
jgi:hypothetical protein